MLGLELWGPLLFALMLTGAGIWSYQGALTAWRSMLQPLSERVAMLEAQGLEQSRLISQQTERIGVLETVNARLERELDESRRRVFALTLQLRDLNILPNFAYYEQHEEKTKKSLGMKSDDDG